VNEELREELNKCKFNPSHSELCKKFNAVNQGYVLPCKDKLEAMNLVEQIVNNAIQNEKIKNDKFYPMLDRDITSLGSMIYNNYVNNITVENKDGLGKYVSQYHPKLPNLKTNPNITKLNIYLTRNDETKIKKYIHDQLEREK
jgi:hypothetical protein